VWPACIVSRADSSAAKTCSVCSLEPCELILDRLEPEGGDEVLLDDPDALCVGLLVKVNVGFWIVLALIGLPSSSGWISCTSTTGTGPDSSSGTAGRPVEEA